MPEIRIEYMDDTVARGVDLTPPKDKEFQVGDIVKIECNDAWNDMGRYDNEYGLCVEKTSNCTRIIMRTWGFHMLRFSSSDYKFIKKVEDTDTTKHYKELKDLAGRIKPFIENTDTNYKLKIKEYKDKPVIIHGLTFDCNEMHFGLANYYDIDTSKIPKGYSRYINPFSNDWKLEKVKDGDIEKFVANYGYEELKVGDIVAAKGYNIKFYGTISEIKKSKNGNEYFLSPIKNMGVDLLESGVDVGVFDYNSYIIRNSLDKITIEQIKQDLDDIISKKKIDPNVPISFMFNGFNVIGKLKYINNAFMYVDVSLNDNVDFISVVSMMANCDIGNYNGEKLLRAYHSGKVKNATADEIAKYIEQIERHPINDKSLTSSDVEYKNDEEQKLTEKMYDFLIKSGYNKLQVFKKCCLDTIRDWQENKKPLRDLLSKSKYWDEDILAIKQKTKSKIFDAKVARNALAEFLDRIFTDKRELSFLYNCTYIDEENPTLINEKTARYWNQYVSNAISYYNIGKKLEIKAGARYSRTIKKILNHFKIEIEDIDAKLANLIDNYFVPTIIDGWCYISINPLDYLSMSFGNSWKSCHHIYEGCYKAGCLSYLNDKTSALFLIKEKPHEDIIKDGGWLCDFTNTHRTVFSFALDGNAFLHSRSYPQGKFEFRQSERDWVESIMSDITGTANNWTVKSDSSAISKLITGDGNHYKDWRLSDNRCVMCYKGKDAPQIEVGSISKYLNTSTPIPLDCSSAIYNTRVYEKMRRGELVVDGDLDTYYDDDGDEYVLCEECGGRIYIEDNECYTDSQGRHYCSDCMRFCEGCGEPIFPYESWWTTADTDNIFCERCCDNLYYCNHCEEWFENELSMVGDECWCESCIGLDAVSCEHCDELVDRDNAFWDDDTEGWYCEDCYNDLIESRDEEDV